MRIGETKKIVMCQKNKDLGGNAIYNVEIALLHGRLQLSAHNNSAPETILVDIPNDKTKQILQIFENNYDLLMDKIQIVDNKLMILAPTNVFKCCAEVVGRN